MAKRGTLSLGTDIKALSAAMFTLSGIRESSVPQNDVCGFFDADKGVYDKIMEAVK